VPGPDPTPPLVMPTWINGRNHLTDPGHIPSRPGTSMPDTDSLALALGVRGRVAARTSLPLCDERGEDLEDAGEPAMPSGSQ